MNIFKLNEKDFNKKIDEIFNNIAKDTLKEELIECGLKIKEGFNMDKEDIEQMQISPITVIQLERILNYLVQNEEYSAVFNDFEIKYHDYYEGENEMVEMFTICRKKVK